MKYDGFFVSPTVHERTVTLGDGSEHVLFFRELSITEFRRFAIAEQSQDDEVRAESIPRLIAASMCEPDGSEAISLEKARTLKPEVANALFKAALSVNRPEEGNG